MKHRKFVHCACIAGAIGFAAAWLPSSAHAEAGIYIEGKLGASFLNADDMQNTTNAANLATVNVKDESATVFAIGASAGYNWMPRFQVPIRTDLEYMYRTALNYAPNPTFTNAATPSKTDADLNSQTLMANAYWDVATWNGFTPFVGGGLGIAINSTDTDGTVLATGVKKNYDQTRTYFAWSIGVGVSYALDSNWSATLGYRFIDLGKAGFGDSNPAEAEITAKDVYTHEALFGIRYQF
jgi:outer membrane immunogenic protein